MSLSISPTPGIYKITCIKNGRIYIGSSINVQRRWLEHKRELNKKDHHNIHLQRAWNKYGAQHFIFQVIEYCGQDELFNREQYWLDKLQPFECVGFNIGRDAQAPQRGRKMSTEFCLNMSIARKGKKRSPEAIAKGAASHRGKKHTPETIIKMSKSAKNRPPTQRTPESIAKQSATMKGRPGKKLTSETREKIRSAHAREWIVTNPDGIEIEITNLKAFCRKNGLDQATMSAVSLGKARQHKGWKCRAKSNHG